MKLIVFMTGKRSWDARHARVIYIASSSPKPNWAAFMTGSGKPQLSPLPETRRQRNPLYPVVCYT